MNDEPATLCSAMIVLANTLHILLDSFLSQTPQALKQRAHLKEDLLRQAKKVFERIIIHFYTEVFRFLATFCISKSS